MKKFKAYIYREWTEIGEVEIEAQSLESATEAAKDMLDNDEDCIKWHGSNMEPGNQGVNSVRELENK